MGDVEIIRLNKAGETKRLHAVETKEMVWSRCVGRAKLLTMGRNLARVMICELAEEACEIKHGGGGHWSKFENQFTVTKFADEVGINSKTLLNWLAVYRYVFKILPKKYQNNSFNWTHGDNTRRLTSKSRDDAPNPTEVKKIYEGLIAKKPKEKIHLNVAKYCGHIHSNIKKLVKTSDLKDVRQLLQSMIDEVDIRIGE